MILGRKGRSLNYSINVSHRIGRGGAGGHEIETKLSSCLINILCTRFTPIVEKL